MTYIKLLKEISVELSEAKAAHKAKKWNIMKICLMRIMAIVVQKLEERKAQGEKQ